MNRPRSADAGLPALGRLSLCVISVVLVAASPPQADEPPPVREVHIKHATVATTKHFNISHLAGMSEERIQQEYRWCRGMAALCLGKCRAVVEHYGPDALDRLPNREPDGRLVWAEEIEPAERLSPADVPDLADAPEPWLLPGHTIEFQRHAARIQRYRGFVQSAIEEYERAIDRAWQVKHGDWETNIRLDIAHTYHSANLWDDAEAAYEVYGDHLVQHAKPKRRNWHYYHGISECYAGRGDFKTALEWELRGEAVRYERALGEKHHHIGLFEVLPPPEGIDVTRPWPELVRDSRMNAYLAQVAHERRNHLNGLRETYCYLATAYRRAGRLEEAEHALETARLTPWHQGLGQLIHRVRLDLEVVREKAHLALARGDAETTLGKADECFEEYDKWLSPGTRVELHDLASRALEQLADQDRQQVQSMSALQRLEQAMHRLKKAIELVEHGRASLVVDQHRKSYFASYTPLYRRAFELALRLETAKGSNPGHRRVRRTFEWAERTKARATLDALARYDRPLAKAIDAGDTAVMRTLRETATKVVSLEALRDASWLGPNVAILEFTYTDQHAYLHVVRPHRDAILIRLDAIPQKIDEHAAELLEAIDPRGTRDTSWVRPAAWLYEHLLKPVEAELDGVSRLLIVGDGRLRIAPFEVLVSQQGRRSDRSALPHTLLIDNYVVSYMPSATLADGIARRVPANANGRASDADAEEHRAKLDAEFLGIACTKFDLPGPDDRGPPMRASQRSATRDNNATKLTGLPRARAEVAAIARRFGDRGTVYVDDQRARDVLLTQDLSPVRYLHFATHAVEFADEPYRSGLVLPTPQKSTSRSMLSLRDIYHLELNCDLIVLSACQTLGKRIPDGDWVDGLARACFCAGTRGVICTLTKLDDRRALELMPDIYAVLHEQSAIESRAGQTARRPNVASALREVKLPSLRRPALSHPANWSAAVYFGLP